jgi:predicted pyridoxine 5'-phosphate oxidase superfamily flavin-nucleotide-binding protein
MDDARAIVVASPWHKGEREMQRRAGAEERMAVVGPRHIRDHLTPQHQEFFPMLPFVIVGAVDPEGDAWATMLSGRPGFLGVPDPRTLHVAAAGAASDPAALGLEDGDAVGLLGIQLETRRRNRLNGIVRKREAGGFDVAVEHSFGNCDKYITVRQHSFARDPAAVVEIRTLQSKALDGRMTRMIREADTLFVALPGS